MPIPILGFGHECFPCLTRGCVCTLFNWSRVNFLCLTMKNSFQRAGCEAHKSGSVRGVVGRPAIPTRQYERSLPGVGHYNALIGEVNS